MLKPLLISLLSLFAIGCDVPAQIVWSPDGTQAAYRSGTTAMLLNAQGIVLQPMGESVGGFAWSADSKSLYFASTDADRNQLTPVRMQWVGPADNSATQPASRPTIEPKSVTVINLLADGKVTPLFRLSDVSVWHLQLSPDGQWLAAMASVDKESGSTQEFRLFVYSIHGGGLYELSRFCGLGDCFTGPNVLAFIEANGLDAVGQISGHIVEVKLDDGAATLPRRPLLDAILPLTRWLEPCKGGLMFTAAPRAFPGSPVQGAPVQGAPTHGSSEQVYKLYHFSCADSGLTVLADDLGELFDASPDGKRILYERRSAPEISATAPSTTEPSNQPLRHDLCVMNANGSDSHVLRSLDQYVGDPKPPMWPAWHGDDQITFVDSAENARPTKVDEHERKVLDVIQYRLTETGTLEALQALSGDWKQEIKPYFHSDESKKQSE